jgi:hypothetical protein
MDCSIIISSANFLSQTLRECAFFGLELEIFLIAFHRGKLSWLSNVKAEANFEDKSISAGNVESAGVFDFELFGELSFGVEGEFGDFVVFLSQVQ